ncbi:hypothetical protein GYMLUDRAFT_914235 [Collybiopsis luxurians FD-317 M1]|nr:hypothetical protein GYMLUDRAFT_914235 [Collybiopsis luxurians FD-317 M1]
MLSKFALLCIVSAFTRPVWSFSFSVNPEPVGVNQDYQISWVYANGEAPDNSFAIEVQGEGGYLKWFGFFNSSGSTTAPGPPSAGTYTLAAYTNVPGANTGTFATAQFTAQDQPGSTSEEAPSTSSVSSSSSTTAPTTHTVSTVQKLSTPTISISSSSILTSPNSNPSFTSSLTTSTNTFP